MNDFDIDFVGLENEKGTHYGGDKGLNHFRNIYEANPSLFHRPILLLYDCDTQKPNEQVGKLWVRSIPHNAENTKVGCVYIVRVIDILVRFWYTHCYEHEKYR